MRFPLVFVLLLFICASPFSRAGFSLAEPGSDSGSVGADGADAFVDAWMTVQQGEKLELAHNYKGALSKFRQGARMLERISKKYPNWSPVIVKYRKDRTADAIARVREELTSGIPAIGLDHEDHSGPRRLEPDLTPAAKPEYR